MPVPQGVPHHLRRFCSNIFPLPFRRRLTTSDMKAEGTFADEIEAISQKSGKDIVYARPDFIALCRYFKPQGRPRTPILADDDSTVPNEDPMGAFAVIHDLAHGISTNFGPSQPALADFNAHVHNAMPSGALLPARMAQCCGRQAPGEQLACRRVDGQRQGPFAERRGPLEPRAGHPVLGDLLCPPSSSNSSQPSPKSRVC
jgi:hypothetical protein